MSNTTRSRLTMLFCCLCEGLQHFAGREQFGQDHGIRFAGGVDQIERHGGAVPAGELGGDFRVAIGPVAAQEQDVAFPKFGEKSVVVEKCRLVGLAGGAPAGGEIHIDKFPRLLGRANRFGTPFFPGDLIADGIFNRRTLRPTGGKPGGEKGGGGDAAETLTARFAVRPGRTGRRATRPSRRARSQTRSGEAHCRRRHVWAARHPQQPARRWRRVEKP